MKFSIFLLCVVCAHGFLIRQPTTGEADNDIILYYQELTFYNVSDIPELYVEITGLFKPQVDSVEYYVNGKTIDGAVHNRESNFRHTWVKANASDQWRYPVAGFAIGRPNLIHFEARNSFGETILSSNDSKISISSIMPLYWRDRLSSSLLKIGANVDVPLNGSVWFNWTYTWNPTLDNIRPWRFYALVDDQRVDPEQSIGGLLNFLLDTTQFLNGPHIVKIMLLGGIEPGDTRVISLWESIVHIENPPHTQVTILPEFSTLPILIGERIPVRFRQFFANGTWRMLGPNDWEFSPMQNFLSFYSTWSTPLSGIFQNYKNVTLEPSAYNDFGIIRRKAAQFSTNQYLNFTNFAINFTTTPGIHTLYTLCYQPATTFRVVTPGIDQSFVMQGYPNLPCTYLEESTNPLTPILSEFQVKSPGRVTVYVSGPEILGIALKRISPLSTSKIPMTMINPFPNVVDVEYNPNIGGFEFVSKEIGMFHFQFQTYRKAPKIFSPNYWHDVIVTSKTTRGVPHWRSNGDQVQTHYSDSIFVNSVFQFDRKVILQNDILDDVKEAKINTLNQFVHVGFENRDTLCDISLAEKSIQLEVNFSKTHGFLWDSFGDGFARFDTNLQAAVTPNIGGICLPYVFSRLDSEKIILGLEVCDEASMMWGLDPRGPRVMWNGTNMILKVIEYLKQGSRRIPISWPPLSIHNAYAVFKWQGDPSISDFNSYMGYPSYGPDASGQAFYDLRSDSALEMPFLQYQKPTLILTSACAADGWRKNANEYLSEVVQSPLYDSHDLFNMNPKGTNIHSSTLFVMYSIVKGMSGNRMYVFDQDPACFTAKRQRTDTWMGYSSMWNLIDQLTPYLMWDMYPSIFILPHVISGTQKSNSHRILSTISYYNFITAPVAVDFTSLTYTNGFIVRYRLTSGAISVVYMTNDDEFPRLSWDMFEASFFLFLPAPTVPSQDKVPPFGYFLYPKPGSHVHFLTQIRLIVGDNVNVANVTLYCNTVKNPIYSWTNVGTVGDLKIEYDFYWLLPYRWYAVNALIFDSNGNSVKIRVPIRKHSSFHRNFIIKTTMDKGYQEQQGPIPHQWVNDTSHNYFGIRGRKSGPMYYRPHQLPYYSCSFTFSNLSVGDYQIFYSSGTWELSAENWSPMTAFVYKDRNLAWKREGLFLETNPQELRYEGHWIKELGRIFIENSNQNLTVNFTAAGFLNFQVLACDAVFLSKCFPETISNDNSHDQPSIYGLNENVSGVVIGVVLGLLLVICVLIGGVMFYLWK